MNICELKTHTCCFFGHRKIEEKVELKNKLYEIIEELILNKNVDIFLFGSKSNFDKLCLKTVTKLKEKYPNIKRIYVRAEFPYIDESYKKYLLQKYDDTYFPEKIINAGKSVYIERNCEMINRSSFCVIYYDKNYLPKKRKKNKNDIISYQPQSGTSLAYNYAVKKRLCLKNVFEDCI